MVRVPVITIDGPGGVGKGTLAQLLSSTLGWHLLDSGALYRVLVVAADIHQVPLSDIEQLVELARGLKIEWQGARQSRIFYEGRDITDQIREEAVGMLASKIAVEQSIRAALKEAQRGFRRMPGLVADGRDMGTVIFPDADFKIYLMASPEARAKRRAEQLKEKGLDVNLSGILADILARDERDSGRAVAPLKPAEDAWVLDTTDLGIEEVFTQVLTKVKARVDGCSFS